MKQMIKNHATIESLEDFIYYDKSSGKIKVKKQIDGVGGTQLYKHTLSITGTDEYDSPTSWTVECIHYLNDVFSATSDDFVKLSKALSMTYDYNAPCYILGAGKLVYLDEDQITWIYNTITAISDVVTPL